MIQKIKIQKNEKKKDDHGLMMRDKLRGKSKLLFLLVIVSLLMISSVSVCALKVMTYNTKAGDYGLDKVINVIKQQNPDVLSLQEIDRNTKSSGYVDQFEILKNKLGMQYGYFSKTVNHDGGDYGIALLSKYPLSSPSAKLYNAKKGEKRLYQRAQINVDGTVVTIFNTHLDRFAENERKKQIQELYDVASQQSGHVIVMGDFNDESSAMDNFKSSFVSVHPDGKTWGKERIDYIFLSKSLSSPSSEIVQSKASDHKPVVSNISFTSTPGGQVTQSQQPAQPTSPTYSNNNVQQSSAVAGQYPQRQKEIDESWIKISSFVGGLLANLVWDTNSNSPKPFSVVYPPIQTVQPTQQSSSPNYPITSGKTQAMTGAVPYTYNAQSLTIPPGLEACVAEVEKLAKAAYEMTSWNSCTQGTVPDVCNPSSPNTCCYMKQSGCCYGIPTDKVNNIRGSCTDNCCGSYVWQVFNVAINKYGLKVDWPLKIAPTTKKGYTQAFERDPGDILSEYYLLSLNQWKTPMMPFDGGNFHPGQVIPGDIIYFKFPQNHKGKCPTEGSSHINIVGPPTEDGKSYYIIDIACKNSGFCKTSTWRYPGFFYKKTYCGDQGGEPLLAGEAWQYVYRVIPECIQATQNQMKGFATYNKGNVIT